MKGILKKTKAGGIERYFAFYATDEIEGILQTKSISDFADYQNANRKGWNCLAVLPYKEMIKAAIFDLNGIFLQSPKLSDRIREGFWHINISHFCRSSQRLWTKCDSQTQDAAFQYWQPVLKEWNVNLSEQEFWDYWFKAEIQSEAMIAFSEEASQQGYKSFYTLK